MRQWGHRRQGAKPGNARNATGHGCLTRRGFTLIELMVVVVIIAILVAIVLPSYIKIKDKAKEAESKAAIHNIQLDLERFGVDNEGEYPPYLIGGDNHALVVRIGDDQKQTTRFYEIDPAQCTDPLIRAGYKASYPINPFVRNALAVQQLQAAVGDPLRSSLSDGQRLGTRFGAQSNLMGQCLCESRYVDWLYYDQEAQERIRVPTWSNIQYEFYDVWGGTTRRRAWLPGSFLYKVCGEIVAQPDGAHNRDYVKVDGEKAIVPHNNRDEATYPVSLSDYVLSAWGGYRTRGLDLLGEEPLVIFSFPGTRRVSTAASQFIFDPSTGRHELAPYEAVDLYTLLGIPPWTRGVNRSHIGPLWGSPYGPSMRDEEQLSVGNANGYNDALILVLTAGR